MKVTLAKEWVGPRGGVHHANKTIDIPDQEARELLIRGLARKPEEPSQEGNTDD